MKRGSSTHIILGGGLLLVISIIPAFGRAEPNDPNRYLNAVQEFADNVLKYGRDTYGPKHTALFIDGLNIHTHEPVKWISPKGYWQTATETEEWIFSNFVSQQTLLRLFICEVHGPSIGPRPSSVLGFGMTSSSSG